MVYSQGNGQAETTNKVIVFGLKKRLDDAKGDGWRNYPTYYGLIAPHPEDQLGRLLFQ